MCATAACSSQREQRAREDSHATVIPLHGDLQVDGRHYIDAFVGPEIAPCTSELSGLSVAVTASVIR